MILAILHLPDFMKLVSRILHYAAGKWDSKEYNV